MKNKKNIASDWSVYLFIVLMILFFFIKPKESAAAALDGFDLWLRNVLPALFPFFVISAFMVNCRIMNLLQPYFEGFTRKIFGVSGSGAFAYLVSIFSGYPVGSKTVCELYQNNHIDKREAQILLTLCSNGGPVFVISTVGAMFYKNLSVALILLAVNYLSAFAAGSIYSKFYKSEKKYVKTFNQAANEKIHYAQAFTKAVTSSVTAIINVGAFIIFFSVVIQLVVALGIIDKAALESGILNLRTLSSSFFISVLELTAGTRAFSAWAGQNMALSVSLSAMAVGFGGLCVFFQSVSFVSETDLSVKSFFFGKLLQSGIAFILGYIISSFAVIRDVNCFHPSGFTFHLQYDWLIFALIMLIIIVMAGAAKIKSMKRKQHDHRGSFKKWN